MRIELEITRRIRTVYHILSTPWKSLRNSDCGCASSARGVSNSHTRPPAKTSTRSLSSTDSMRCAIVRTVQCRKRRRIVAWMSASVSESIAESIGFFIRTSRKLKTRGRWALLPVVRRQLVIRESKLTWKKFNLTSWSVEPTKKVRPNWSDLS